MNLKKILKSLQNRISSGYNMLVGRLVNLHGRGVGVVIDSRITPCSKLQLKVYWIRTPYINFINERRFGWYLDDSLGVLSN